MRKALSLAGNECRVALTHRIETAGCVAVQSAGQLLLEQWEDVPHQSGAASHPLVVGAAAVVIKAVQTRLKEALYKPSKQGLVPRVHPQRHLGLLAVAAERALADQEADDHAALELR